MFKIILTGLLILTGIAGFAQNGGTVSGRIYDGTSNQPLPFATILLNDPVTA